MTRCPACGAAVREGDQWCTLCYADLRVKAAPAPTAAPAAGTGSLPVDGTQEIAAGLPLTAAAQALSAALGEIGRRPAAAGHADGGAAERGAADGAAAGTPAVAGKKKAQWPCLDCGTSNPIEATHCVTCGRAFALEPTLDIRALKAERQKRIMLAISVAVGFVMIVVIISLLTSSAPSNPPADEGGTVVDDDTDQGPGTDGVPVNPDPLQPTQGGLETPLPNQPGATTPAPTDVVPTPVLPT